MRKVLSPQRDVMALLAKRGDARISEHTAVYFRDVYDHLARTVESIEANRDLLGNALDAYLSAIGQRTNEIMKALTILSAIFMPLTFITGFFGQNFEHLPFDSDPLMWAMLVSLVLTPRSCSCGSSAATGCRRRLRTARRSAQTHMCAASPFRAAR